MIFIIVSSVSDDCTYCSHGVHGVYTDIDLAIERCEEIINNPDGDICKPVSDSEYKWMNESGRYTLEIREEELNKPLEIW